MKVFPFFIWIYEKLYLSLSKKLKQKDMEFIDIRKNTKCPNCKNDLYNHIWNVDNVLSFSSKKEGFHYNEGSYFYRNVFYKCPHCGVDCCIEMHNSDMFVRKLVEKNK